MAKRSRLESLPVELLHEICGYLLPSHDPLSDGSNKVTNVPAEFDQTQYNCSGPATIHPHLPGHALLTLQLASRHLRSVADSFSALQLDTWVKATTGTPSTDNDKLRPESEHTRILISWTQRYCVFCGVYEGYHRDIFANGCVCCKSCHDERLKNELICRHEAWEVYGLTMTNLVNYTSRLENWPVLRFGWYNTNAVGDASIAFRKCGVGRLATAVFGDWKLRVSERTAKQQEAKDDLVLLEEYREKMWPDGTYW